MNTTLTPEQELIVVDLRKTFLLATDDLLSVTREFNETVPQGELFVVCDPSATGKSTLNRVEPIQSSRITINGQDIDPQGLGVNQFRSHIGS